MTRPGLRTLLPGALALCLLAPAIGAAAPPQTVCTITVNSSDEKDSFRHHLPAAKYRFVELVERGRPDWLASACQAGVSCDVLIISGHYDGGNVFFSDQLAMSEFLPVDELERISCSESCPGLFSRLKEVHLFGCNTLNPQALSSASAEVVRGLVREGHSLKEAERQLLALNAEHGESGRDRMRQVFKDVPVIYGFSSVAPLGPVAASALGGYFRTAGSGEIGRGRVSSRLLGHFTAFGMTATRGIRDGDPQAAVRDDVCRFANDRVSDADKLGFVHQLLQRGAGQARVHLDRIQRLAAELDQPLRRTPAVTLAFADIAEDGAARERFLDFTRDADQPAVRARMLKVAHDLGWLTAAQRWQELQRMLEELQARKTVGLNEVNLACTLNQERQLDGAFDQRFVPSDRPDEVARAAVLACLGSHTAQARTLLGLVGPAEAEVRVAQAYLRHRPLEDAAALRGLADSIARMPASPAQVRALETLGRHYVSDRGILDRLARLFSETPSWPVQTAVAGILLRADLRLVARPQLAAMLQRDRRNSPPEDDVVDALLRRLQAR